MARSSSAGPRRHGRFQRKTSAANRTGTRYTPAVDRQTSAPDGEGRHDSEDWRKGLVEGHGAFARRLFRTAPQGPRCAICFAPFHGIGGRVFSLVGFRPSRKNPRYCTMCFERAPHGGAEVDAGIFFADIRGFTAWSESRAPEAVATHLNRFYRLASNVLIRNGAIIDKLSGDGVMAIFVPGSAGADYIERMVDSAVELIHDATVVDKGGTALRLGVGLDRGDAYVGNVGAGEIKDFTAIGDVVNTASRLQAEAMPGQIVMSERVFAPLRERYPEARELKLDLRGKTEPVAARVVDVVESRES